MGKQKKKKLLRASSNALLHVDAVPGLRNISQGKLQEMWCAVPRGASHTLTSADKSKYGAAAHSGRVIHLVEDPGGDLRVCDGVTEQGGPTGVDWEEL